MKKPKQICICGSMAFIDKMEALAARLREADYAVDTPVREEVAIDWASLPVDESAQLKRTYIDRHLTKIERADAVLIANYAKNGVDGYIGANTLMEVAFAHALGKPVAFLLPIGEQPCRLEALAVSQVVVGPTVESLASMLE